MNTIKTSELSGKALDYAVARCEGVAREAAIIIVNMNDYNPSVNWLYGGPLIERNHMAYDGQMASLIQYNKGKYNNFGAFGPTMLIAAMRCYVASVLGDEVDVPDELL